MRFLVKSLITVGLALGLATSASALSVSLTQSGGTYNATAGASASDTLTLTIDVTTTAGDVGSTITSLDPSIDLGGTGTFTGGTETSFIFNPAIFSGLLSPIVAGCADCLQTLDVVDGWEATSAGGVSVTGAGTVSLGTITIHLNGAAGVLDTNAGGLFATFFGGAGGANITGSVGLGTFTVNAAAVPEPTTVAMLGMGLLGLAISGRRR